jgi:hypothetical protein
MTQTDADDRSDNDAGSNDRHQPEDRRDALPIDPQIRSAMIGPRCTNATPTDPSHDDQQQEPQHVGKGRPILDIGKESREGDEDDVRK